MKQLCNNYEYIAMSTGEEQAKSVSPGACILVVEDDVINQRVAKLLLEHEGYQVSIASRGDSALKLYASGRYQLILLDLGLPDMSGLEVAQKIRALEQDCGKHTPIIALTAHGAACAKSACLAAGMDDFSSKPFEFEALNRLIKNWLGKSA